MEKIGSFAVGLPPLGHGGEEAVTPLPSSLSSQCMELKWDPGKGRKYRINRQHVMPIERNVGPEFTDSASSPSALTIDGVGTSEVKLAIRGHCTLIS